MKYRRILPVLLLAGAFIVCIVFIIFYLHNRPKTYTVEAITVQVDSLSQIVLVEDSLVKPFIYTQVSGLGHQPVPKAKALFISVLLPAVLIAKHEVEEKKRKLVRLAGKKQWNKADSAFYLDTKNRYKAAGLNDLLERMGTLPNSIVLAQAAMESGWGQSRFFREANNVFGIWSYNALEPRIRAGQARGDSFVYVRVYDNIAQSVADYFKTLGSARAYRSLRQARLETDDPYALLPHLRNYSERRMKYVAQLETIIRKNDLTHYDHFRIHPDYVVEEME